MRLHLGGAQRFTGWRSADGKPIRQHEADIARAKAFVEAVAKQKRGQGE